MFQLAMYCVAVLPLLEQFEADWQNSVIPVWLKCLFVSIINIIIIIMFVWS